MTAPKVKKGMTLVEIIISIAIIGILGITFFSMFTSGFKGVVRAGNKSTASYDAQAKIEETLNDKPSAGDPGNTHLRINFNDSTYIDIEGKLETQSTTVNNSQVDITVFNPVN